MALNSSVLQTANAASFLTNNPLAIGRYFHTSTLLPNGKVLVTGGVGNSGKLASAELYDPATGKWTATGSLNIARRYHTATLLQNGKVLVAGGQNSSNVETASAELYDPATGIWTATGALKNGRYVHTATLLPNGKLLVAGGLGGSTYLATAELYDPASGTWTTTGALTDGRYGHTATLLPNGKVMAAGGAYLVGATVTHRSSAELYDPASGLWTPTGSLISARDSHTATLLPNGKVLFAAGYGVSGRLASAELYDPATGTNTATAALTTAREFHSATLLPNGKVLVAGGDDNSSALSSTQLYDPAAGTWSTNSAMTTARSAHTATLLPDGRMMVAGGEDNIGNLTTSVERYDWAAGAWAGTGGMATARRQPSATLLPNGKALIAGGVGSSGATNKMELYDPVSGLWTTTGALNTARAYHTATLLVNGKVLAMGGSNSGSGFLASAELYDPATGMNTATGTLNTGRREHTTTLLANGLVLVAGGFGSGGITNSAELYDPTAGTWTATNSMITARKSHSATLLPNGKLLVAGGQGSSGVTNKAELFDPATGLWTATGTMTNSRSEHTATLLPNGKVLVAGGQGSSGATNRAEVYDPSTGLWTATGPLGIARRLHTATLLPNGRVLVAGGYGSGGGVTNRAELYDPATGTWTATGALATSRAAHTVTLLPNGKLLIAGGAGSGGLLSSAEFYDVGLSFSNSWTPQITTVSSPLNPGGSLALTGDRFRGISGASCGNSQDSPGDFPLVQLRSMESGQSWFLLGANWSTNSFTSAPVNGFPAGYALATIFVNGVPSPSSIVLVDTGSIPTPPQATTLAATSISVSNATLNATINPGGADTTVYFQYGLTTGYGGVTTTSNLPAGLTTVGSSNLLSGLTPGTLYHFRVVANNSAGTNAGADLTFTTAPILPQATTLAATSINVSNATLNATVNPGGAETAVYFQYGLTSSYGSVTTTSNLPAGLTTVGTSNLLSGLTPGTLYHFRVVATNSAGTNAGADLTFTTAPILPQVTTIAATSINVSNATLNATVNPGGAATAVHFQYGLTSSYGSVTTTSNLPAGLTTLGTSNLLSGLTPGTLYHFRVIATNSAGTNAGLDLTFTTAPILPQVATLAATSISVSNATLNAIVNPGGADTTVYFQYGLTSSYGSATTTSNLTAGLTPVDTSNLLSGLTPGTLYHFRVVATNSAGTNAGADLTFTTAPILPQATTLAATSISVSNATLNATVNPGGADTTVYFQHGLTSSYGSVTTTSNLPAGLTTLATSNLLSGLMPGTLYHFRVVATNTAGTNAGPNLTFTTAPILPQATTLAATSISVSNATLNAIVNPGGADTTVYFQYGLSTNYGSTTMTANLPAGLTTLGTSNLLSSLTPGTLYHFRVVATNSAGTDFGADLTFTTVFPVATPPNLANPTMLGGTFQFAFTNTPGAPFTVLSTTNIALPLTNWTLRGPATETTPGQFQFTDPQATNSSQRFYRVQSN